MAQAMRLLVAGSPLERVRLDFLRKLSPECANGEMLAAAAGVLRALAPRIPFAADVVFDCCGTGGDRLGLFNVSTLAGLTVAAAGVAVAKHGNRAITSGCGSADLLEALGVPIDATPEQAAESLRKHCIAFLFAPLYHKATRNVQPLRLQLKKEGIATFFNLIGPLSNPLSPNRQLVGVFHPRFLRSMAEALQLLGCEHGWVVCGQTGDGRWMDEISPCGPTQVCEITAGRIEESVLSLEDLGFEPVSLEELKGGDIEANARIAREVLAGSPSAQAEAVCLNAGVGLYLAGKAVSVIDGVAAARELIQSGQAAQLMSHWAATR
jgi:anthranilate phosphoribosyltransferase